MLQGTHGGAHVPAAVVQHDTRAVMVCPPPARRGAGPPRVRGVESCHSADAGLDDLPWGGHRPRADRPRQASTLMRSASSVVASPRESRSSSATSAVDAAGLARAAATEVERAGRRKRSADPVPRLPDEPSLHGSPAAGEPSPRRGPRRRTGRPTSAAGDTGCEARTVSASSPAAARDGGSAGWTVHPGSGTTRAPTSPRETQRAAASGAAGRSRPRPCRGLPRHTHGLQTALRAGDTGHPRVAGDRGAQRRGHGLELRLDDVVRVPAGEHTHVQGDPRVVGERLEHVPRVSEPT